jgi:hypothetical protein
MIPRLRRALGLALALSVASCPTQQAYAQNQPPVGLPPRGAVQPTDVIVDQPAGSSTVQGVQASALLSYVQSNFAAAGTSGQVQINSGGAFAGVTVSGDGTLSSSGALTVTKSNGTAFGSFAFQNYGSLPSASGSPPISAGTVFPCLPSTVLNGCTGAQLLTYVTGGPIGADPTGAADSTSALQSWLNAGSPGTIPCGTYKTTATLTMETAANNGQQVRGSGAGSSTGAGACRTVIQPTSAVTTALVIDGTPISTWIMGIGLHDIVFDMTNMTDASTTSAIKQVQAFDVSYERVRVINGGVNKRGWLFNAGAYTSSVNDSQAHLIDLEGASSSNAVTTLTFKNVDVGQYIGNYAYKIAVLGGAVQPTYNSATMTPVYVTSSSTGVSPALSAGCASGCYMIPAETVTNSDGWTFTGDIEQGGGFPSTYNDGTHGTLTAVPVVEIPSTWTRVTFVPDVIGGMYLYDLSTSAFAIGANVGGGAPYNLIDAPTTFANGATIPAGGTLTLGSAQTWPGAHFRPSTDGDQIVALANAAGSNLVDCGTGGGGCAFNNGQPIGGYTDSFTTNAWNISMPSSGTALMVLRHSGSTTITLTGANGSGVFTGGVTAYQFRMSTLVTGTPASYACFDASGDLISSSVPC